MAIDLVCRMPIPESEAEHTSTYKGKLYFFCAEPCKQEFDNHPNDYVSRVLDIAFDKMFCPRCGDQMRHLSPTDRIQECVGCGYLGLPFRFEPDNPSFPRKLETLLKKCPACDSVMLADDLFCRTCGGKSAQGVKKVEVQAQ